MLMRKIIILFLSAAALLGCTREVLDTPTNAYVFSAEALTVAEGEDIPVRLSFSSGGLDVDNAAWGNPWEKAVFHGAVYDSYGRVVENAVFSGPDGILADGTIVNIPRSGRYDLVVGALRKGDYVLKVNMETRYTVDTWASTTMCVTDAEEPHVRPDPGGPVMMEWFSVPDKNAGLDVDDQGNIVLDLRFYNVVTPFRFTSVITPPDATDPTITVKSKDDTILLSEVDGGLTMVLSPLKVGVTSVEAVSGDGGVRRTFGVRVIETYPDAEGFTLPTDDGERDAYDLDVAGRLALDINEYNSGNPFQYTCKPIPSGAVLPGLTADSDDKAVLLASIGGDGLLVLTPQKPGYATVTVSTTGGGIVRTMRVAVISNFSLVIDTVEENPSEEDKKTAIFPCKLTIKSTSDWLPSGLHVEVYGKGTGRVDLTDPADYFIVDSLRNARSAFWSFEEKVPVIYLSGSGSAYNVYTRLMKKVASISVAIHHSDDYPDYYDYVSNFRLYSIRLSFVIRQDYDTNIYRGVVDERYDSPKYRIYQYLN